MKVSIEKIDNESNNNTQKPPAQVVHVVIVRLNFAEDTVKGIFHDSQSAAKLISKEQRRLKRMRWDDFEVFSQPWKVS